MDKIEIAQRGDKILAHGTIRNTDIENSERDRQDVVSVASVPNTRIPYLTLPLEPNWPGFLIERTSRPKFAILAHHKVDFLGIG
jgi:hypothetical protein